MVIGIIINKINEWKHQSLKAFSNFLFHYGGYVYDRPYKFIVGSLLCSLLLTTGFYFKENEKDLYKLYALSDSFAHETKTTISNFFYNTRKSFVLVESNCNVLEPDILKELKKFEDGIKNIKVKFSEVSQCMGRNVLSTGNNTLSSEVFTVLDNRRKENVKILKLLQDSLNSDEIKNDINNDDITIISNNNVAAGEGGTGGGDSNNNIIYIDDIPDPFNWDDEEATIDETIENEKVGTEGGKDYETNLTNESSSSFDTERNTEDNKPQDVFKDDEKNSSIFKGSVSKIPNAPTLNDYKDDMFVPVDYLPPMLENANYCSLKNVFGDKYPDIDLRALTKEQMELTFGYDDICDKVRNSCNTSSLFLYYEDNSAPFGGPIELDDASLANAFPFYINPKTDKPMLFTNVLGKMKFVKTDTWLRIDEGYSTLTVIPLLSSYKYEPYVLAFEKRLIKYVTSYEVDPAVLEGKTTNDGEAPFLRFSVFTNRSIEDEVDRISRIDNLTRCLLLIGVLLIFLYTLFNNLTSVLYRSKPLCAVMGIICGFLGYLSGSGLLFFFGVKFVPPAETVPFLVIGVGVDDIFVILNSYSLLFMIKDHKKRIQICLKDSALAITVTTLTNIIAFLISAISPFYSICSFSVYTASSLFFCYVMVLTFFLSFLCIEAKLENQKKSVCSCTLDFFNFCVKRKREEETQDHTITVPYNDGGDSDKKYIAYEEISIYEWIHNLYLFEESINKKKTHAASALANGNCSSVVDGGNEQDSFCHGRGISDLNEIEEGTRNELTQKKDHSKRDCLNADKYTEGTPVEDNCKGIEGGGGKVVNETKAVSMAKKKGKKDNIQFVEMDDLNKDAKDEEDAKDGKSTNNTKVGVNNVNFTSRKIESDEGATRASNSATRETNNRAQKIKKKGEEDIETQDKVTEEARDSLRDSVKGSTCHYNNSLEEDTKHVGINTHNGINKQVYLLSSHDNAMFYGYIYKEPEGNIGKYFRMVIKKYYVPLLSSRIGKIAVYILFTIIIGIALYGCTLMKKGIKFNNAFPTDSYIRQFSNGMNSNFPDHGNIIEVCYFDENFLSKYKTLMGNNPHNFSFIFYPENINNLNNEQKKLNTNIRWEKKEMHEVIKKMSNDFKQLEFVAYISNGFEIFLEKYGDDYANDSREFHEFLGQWLQTHSDGMYFKNDFIILNEQLVAWRFYYYQKNTEDTETFGKWLKKCQENSFLKDHNVKMVCFHFSSIFIEADEAIIEVTAKHLGITVITVLIVTAYIVKGLYSCLIITVIIFLIDLCIFGFMCLCQITINIISMVILVLSVGFCIDHTSHIVQAFMHSHGRTRNEKMKESLHLMIGPVVHSGLSTWFVISTLFFSNKDFTVIFFQTLSLVLFFSIIFSSIFLPVLLSSIGPL